MVHIKTTGYNTPELSIAADNTDPVNSTAQEQSVFSITTNTTLTEKLFQTPLKIRNIFSKKIQNTKIPKNTLKVCGYYGDLPDFSKITPKSLSQCFELAFEELSQTLDELAQNLPQTPTWENLVQPYFDALKKFNYIQGTISFIAAFKPSDNSFSELDNKASVEFEAKKNSFFISPDVLEKFKTVKDSHPLSESNKQLLIYLIKQMENSGMKLNDVQLAELKKIDLRLAELGNEFEKNTKGITYTVTDPSLLTGVPSETLKKANEQYKANNPSSALEGYLFAIPNDYLVVWETAENRDFRKELFTARNQNFAPDNYAIAKEMLNLRQQKAALFEYSNYAEYRFTTSNFFTLADVEKMLSSHQQKTTPLLQKEMAALEAFGKTEKYLSEEDTIQAYDINFLAKKYSEKHEQATAEELSKYFTAKSVQAGCFEYFSQLFGVEFVEASDVPRINDDVQAYYVKDTQTKKNIGLLYMDLYQSSDKPKGPSSTSCLGARMINNEELVAVCSYAAVPPGQNNISLKDVNTIFHELSHSMRYIFSHLKNPKLPTGIVDLPADIGEIETALSLNFLSDVDFLWSLTSNHLKGETITDDFKALHHKHLTKIDPDQTYNELQKLLPLATDLALHQATDLDEAEMIALWRETAIKYYGPLAESPEFISLTRNSHSFKNERYAASMHTYNVGDVISQKIYQELFNSKEFALTLEQKGDILKNYIYASSAGVDPKAIFAEVFEEDFSLKIDDAKESPFLVRTRF